MKSDIVSPEGGQGPVKFFTAIVLLAVVAAVATDNVEFAFHSGGAAAVGCVVLWVRRSLKLTTGFLWMLAIVGTLHLLGGLVPVPHAWPTNGKPMLYNLWLIDGLLKYDHLVHGVGYGAAAVGFWQVLRGLAPQLRPTAGPMLLCWLAAQGCGALNEIAEFAAVLTIEETLVGGFHNAMLDLVVNAVGAGLSVLVIAMWPLVRRASARRENGNIMASDPSC
jgi:putative membrane protein